MVHGSGLLGLRQGVSFFDVAAVFWSRVNSRPHVGLLFLDCLGICARELHEFLSLLISSIAACWFCGDVVPFAVRKGRGLFGSGGWVVVSQFDLNLLSLL